jgi:hypothetical protein
VITVINVMYAKIFKSMFDGSLRGKSDALLVFTNLLANADEEGFVDRHPRAIAEETGLPLDRVNEAVTYLEAPDHESRSPELDGRRLERLDEHRSWGWRIVNYLKYRNIKRQEHRRQQNRESQARFRQNSKQKKITNDDGGLRNQTPASAYASTSTSPDLGKGSGENPLSNQKRKATKPPKKEKTGDEKKRNEMRRDEMTQALLNSDSSIACSIPPSIRTEAFIDVWVMWVFDRKSRKKPLTDIAWSKQLEKLSEMGLEKAIHSLNESMMNGWTGLFEPKDQNATNSGRHKEDAVERRKRLMCK